MNLMAKQHGIRYGAMRYLPGSGVRARGMLQGRIKATIVDIARRNQLLDEGNGKFAILLTPKLYGSDEALFARRDYLKENANTVIIFLEEMLKVWRKINHNPSYILEVRAKYNLLPNLSKKKPDRLEKYYSEMAFIGSFPMNGGGASAVHADFAFYTFAGTIQRNSSELKIEDFWDLKPLNAALDRLGIVKLQ